MARTIVTDILLLSVGGFGGVIGSTVLLVLVVGGLAGSFLEGWVDDGGMFGVDNVGRSIVISLRPFAPFGTSDCSDFVGSET